MRVNRRGEGLRAAQRSRPRHGSSAAEGELGVEALETNPKRRRGIKQEALADAMGVSRQTISSLENGRYNPSVILAIKLARYFGMKVEDIFIYEEESNEA